MVMSAPLAAGPTVMMPPGDASVPWRSVIVADPGVSQVTPDGTAPFEKSQTTGTVSSGSSSSASGS